MNHNLQEVLISARKLLLESGVPNGRDADFIMEFVLGHKIILGANEYLNSEQYNQFIGLINRRINREPMDSILGVTEFLGISIPFSKNTLSPRQETEIMVDNIIRENYHRDKLKVLDICCGSGCIGLSIAKYLGADVTLSDISREALDCAKECAKVNNITANFIESDLFENIDDVFDIIISNPPYIVTSDLENLEPEVRDYDPELALDGGEDGLVFYRRLIDDLPKYLNKEGLVYMEFGIGQAEEIVAMLRSHFDNIEIIKDYGGIDRYVKARKKIC